MRKLVIIFSIILFLLLIVAILLTYTQNNQQSDFNMNEFIRPPGYHISHSFTADLLNEYDEGLYKVREYNGYTWFGSLSAFSLGSSYSGESVGGLFDFELKYLYLGNTRGDDYLSFLSVESGVEQIALVGYTSVSCRPIIEMGYTIPYKVYISTNDCRKIRIGYHEGGKDGDFEKINNEEPTIYKERLSELCNVLRANKGEKFTFSYFEGTQYLHETIVADHIYYIVGDGGSSISLPITKTTKGYFLVDYSQLSPGYYCIGVGYKNIIVEIK